MRRVIIFCVLVFVAAAACQKDIKEVFSTTPYNLQVPPSLPSVRLPKDNPLTIEGIGLGRKLFFDPILSKDSTQSCASCHNQSFAFTDDEKVFSIGVEGLPGMRNSMPLFNLMYHPSFFWDGRAKLLRHQALEPIVDPLEMNEELSRVVSKLKKSAFYASYFEKAFGKNSISETNIGLALEQFMLTFISGNSKFDQYLLGQTQLSAQEVRGMQIFNREANLSNGDKGGECFHCHGTGLFTNNQFMNNGLDSIITDPGLGAVTGLPTDNGKFKVPSLRNIAKTAPYMHDGRFATLDEVLEFYNSSVVMSPNIDPNMHGSLEKLNLNASDLADLKAFLLTLTDQAFLDNPAYGSPF